MKIPLMKPVGPPLKLVEKYLIKIHENGIYSNNGPLVQELEERFAEYFNIDKELIVLCANATQGISGLSFLSPAKNFICPSFAFAASALGLKHSFKKFTFADIDPVDWDLDISNLEIDMEKGLLVVLPFGDKPNYEKFDNFKNVIFDAAASIGNPDLNLSRLKENWAAVFSLHATKILGIGEGGLAVFGNKDSAANFRKYINFGFWHSRESKLLGSNLKISEYTAAVGLAVLDNLEQEFKEWNYSRESVIQIENDLSLKSFSSKLQGVNPYWILKFDSQIQTNRVKKILTKHDIDSRHWWGTGLHNWKIFQDIEQITDLKNTQKVANSYLGLPFYRNMDSADLYRVKTALEKIYE